MLTLRKFKESDIELLAQYLNNPQVTRYITDAIPKPYTLKDAKWWVESHSNSSLVQAIDYDGVFVGCISAQLGSFEYSRSAEIGYWLGQKHWNKGIATLAVNQFVEHLFNQTELMRLFVSVVAENAASIRVLEKSGFKNEGLLKSASYKNGEFFDECLMSKVKRVDTSK